MGASRSEARRRSPVSGVLAQAELIGAALAALGLGSGSLVLFRSTGLLSATTGLIATLAAALLLGLWAGAPGASAEDSPLRGRWLAASLTTGVGGAFASLWTLHPTLGDGPVGRAAALLLLVAAPAYTLGLLLPALLAAAERQDDEDDALPGWGMLGVVVAGVLLGIVFGAMLVGLALLPWLSVGPLLLGVGALLSIPALRGEGAAAPSQERALFRTETPFARLSVVEVEYSAERQPERRLLLNDEQESGELVRSGAPTLAYVAAAERWLAETGPAAGASYLFLGGGAYTLPRRVAERDPRARIAVVELDPEVTRVAYRFFGVRREHGIQTYHGDARAFARTAAAGAYDRVYLDVYTGGEALPYHLTTREAYEELRRLLRPGGWLALNVIARTTGGEARRFWSLVRTLAEVFPTVAVYVHLGRDYPERQNLLVAASPEAGATPPARAGFFEPWPREEWAGWAGTAVFRDLEPAAAPQPVAEQVNG